MAEKRVNDRDGIEYILQMDDGRLVTLVQNREVGEQPLADGTPVLVQLNGAYTRVMAHPGAVDHDAGGWVDPDAAAPAPDAGASAGSRDLLFSGSGTTPRPGTPETTTTGTAGGAQQ
jgi:hypothetical protein